MIVIKVYLIGLEFLMVSRRSSSMGTKRIWEDDYCKSYPFAGYPFAKTGLLQRSDTTKTFKTVSTEKPIAAIKGKDR